MQCIWDTLVGSLATPAAEGNLLLSDHTIRATKKGMCTAVSPRDSTWPKMHRSRMHVFSDLVCDAGEGDVRSDEKIFYVVRIWSANHLDRSPVEVDRLNSASMQVELRCTCWRRSEQHVSSDVPPPHHHGCDELAVTDKHHRGDEPSLQTTAITRDYAGRFRPGHWDVVGPGLKVQQAWDGTSERKLEPQNDAGPWKVLRI